ncbi:MAG: chromosome segregation protein SMC [Polyangiaceae bacterium]|nr:chromosome segregation protein SMC [Polyangiaceae bacterium]
MHIKRLEIHGFKSFVDRTVIPFDHDVIGIVGPNGCGKSNIVDAIRWCIGEQSARHLRGKSMADVIFNGSESRGPMGLAEVTLVFDNSDFEAARSLPIEYRDYPEIAVTRRLYRDGTSEYLINKAQVRLKDLTDLFLGTGVGAKAYSIVEQGKIGLIISARPEDRRSLIEEAAGITKYKHRRKQAEQKMELTRQNLTRVGDVVAEIERGLASLKRQAQKAERYKAYRQEFESRVLHEASHRYLELKVRTDVAVSALAGANEELSRARLELGAQEAGHEASKTALYERERLVDKTQNAAFAASSEVKALEAGLTRARDKLAALREREGYAAAELDDVSRQRESLEAERGALAGRLGSINDDEREGAEQLETAQERLEELRAEEQATEQALGALRARALEASSRVAAAEAKLEGSKRRVRDAQGRLEKLALDEATLREEGDTLETRRVDLATELAEAAESEKNLAAERVRLDAELKQVRESLVGLERELEGQKNELSQRRGRLRALEELQKRLEGVGTGPKHLLNAGDPSLVLGLVAERLEAPPELTDALAGLLGDRLQDVVVTDMSRGVALLAELRRQRKGRAALVPRRPSFVAGGPRASLGGGWHQANGSNGSSGSSDGLGGPLARRLRYAPADEALVRSLVGDAELADSWADVERLGPRARGRTFVCLDGTVVHANGRVVGGAGDAVAAGMLSQQREIRELNASVSTLADAVSAAVAKHAALRERAGELQTSLERTRGDAHRAEIARVGLEKDLRRCEEQTLVARRRLEALAAERVELDDRLAEAADEESEARDAADGGRDELAQAKDALGAAEAAVGARRERVGEQQALVTERKVRLARLREQAGGIRSTSDRLGASLQELASRVEKLARERVDGARLFGATAAHIVVDGEKRGRAAETAREAEAALETARAAFDEARQALALREGSLKDLRARAASWAEKKAELERELERLTIGMGHLLEGVREKFRGLDLRRVIGDYHRLPLVDEAHRARTTELQELIDRMGPVNLEAVREHEEAQKRYDFYTTQRADLEAALDDLDKAIAQMDRESRKLFRETFDSINEKFRVMFPKMFRGGTARLELTGSEDVLAAGVEILAQPPGKKVSNIELMSGGEKALTAVSLLLAMFQHKPSPFCILDEVDAPLDEANVARYNEAVRSMTDQSQFILITHIKRTMQSVDVLFGVTMQEPGVSKLVSVKINETAIRRGGEPSAAVA